MKNRVIAALVYGFALVIPMVAAGQGLKFRFSGNSTRFMKEPQGKEILHFFVDSVNTVLGPFSDFSHRGGLGFEAEMYGAVSERIYAGFEIGNNQLTGENDNPGLYNFQFTDSLQLYYYDPMDSTTYFVRSNYPLKYRTTLWSLMFNLRFYPLPEGMFRPFVKGSAGISLVGTDLSLKNPAEWQTDTTLIYGPPVLFSTDRSGMMAALTIGAGLGFELKLNRKLSLYADWSYKMIRSDIVDGIPNFDYHPDTGRMTRFSSWTNTSKISFGIVYTLNENFYLTGGGGSGKKGSVNKRTSPHLPFYELKPGY